MINLETVQFLKAILTNLIAYIPTITFAGFFSAWIAKRLGDNTPEENGYLTLNPLSHLDPLGIFLMVIPPYLGFSRGVPLNASNLSEPNKKPKVIFLYLARSIAYFFVLIFALFSLNVFKRLFLRGITLQTNVSSLFIVFLLIFKAIIGLSVFCMVLHLISGFIKTIGYFYLPNFEENPNYFYIMFLVPIMILFIFGPLIEYLLRMFIISMDHFFMYLLS